MDDKTIKTYNQKAAIYKAETDDFWQRFPSEFIDTFIKNLEGKKILDIGSGPGRDAEIFKNSSLDVVCVDASEVMVNMTMEKGFNSVVGNFKQIPFKDKSFDGIWAYTSLLHIHKKDVPDAFWEMYRVMKAGAVLGLGLIEGSGEEERLSMGEDFPRLFSYFTREEIENIAQKANFKPIYFKKHSVGAKTYLHSIFRKI